MAGWGRVGVSVLLVAAVGCKVDDPLEDRTVLADGGFEIPEQPMESDAGSGWTTSSGFGESDVGLADDLPVLPATAPAETASARYHTVTRGDTLFALARQYYRDEARWRLIFDSNRDQLGDPNVLYVGQRLRIP